MAVQWPTVEKKTLVFNVACGLEENAQGQEMLRACVTWATTGTPLKPDGWQFVCTERLYIRALEDYVAMECEQQEIGGPHCDYCFLGRDGEPLSKYIPLYDQEAESPSRR
eukprot:s733_g3.t1